MKTWLATCIMVAVLAIFSINAVAQDGDAVGLDIALGYQSKYIWRGRDMNPDDDAILAPMLGYKIPDVDIKLSMLGAWDLDDSNLDRIDWGAEYTTTVDDGMDLAVGLIYYWSDTPIFKDTWEIYAGLTLTEIILEPNLTIYYDADANEGIYANLSGKYQVEVQDGYMLDLAAGIGYFMDYGLIDDGIADIDISASMDFDIGGGFMLTPEAHVVIVDDKTVNKEDEVWFGAKVMTTL